MTGGIPITKKQRYLAGRTDLVALLRSRGETLKKLGSEWEWKFHDERVTIRGHLWFDQYTQKGGDAVDFFRYFYGESEEQAAAMLLNCSMADLDKLPARSPPNLPRTKQEEQKQLAIPAAHKDMRRVFAYLCQTRGIAPEVVSAFARKGLLYESADHHNAVFVGRDRQGQPRYAALRGTVGDFKGEAPGSDKRYSFAIAEAPATPSVHLFESAIDLLSYATLLKMKGRDWRQAAMLSLAGVFKQKKETVVPLALSQYLQDHPNVHTLCLHLDNDEVGRDAAAGIMEALGDRYEVLDRPPPSGKDTQWTAASLPTGCRRGDPSLTWCTRTCAASPWNRPSGW